VHVTLDRRLRPRSGPLSITLDYPIDGNVGPGSDFAGLVAGFTIMTGDLLLWSIGFPSGDSIGQGLAVSSLGHFATIIPAGRFFGHVPADGASITLDTYWRRADFSLVEHVTQAGPYTWSYTVALGRMLLDAESSPPHDPMLDTILAAVTRTYA
jgi:hypothetical protein